jgi:hypothetical protein
VLAKTTDEALALWHEAKERQLALAEGSDDHERLGTVIVELEQVVSMLSDADVVNADVLVRAIETVDQARQIVQATFDRPVCMT